MTTNLETVLDNLESILDREVKRIHGSGESLDRDSSQVLERVSKMLDICIKLRSTIPKSTGFEDVKTEELEDMFND